MKNKKLCLIPENENAINEKILEVVGKRNTYINFSEIKPKSYFSKRLLKDTIYTCYPSLSLTKSYKYQKEYGFVRCQHDGKEWYFLDCLIGKCNAGSHTPSNVYYFTIENEIEITKILLQNNNIIFI